METNTPSQTQNRFQSLLQHLDRKRLLGIGSIILLLSAIPFTLYIENQNQDIRQRASAGNPALAVSPDYITQGSTFTASWSDIPVGPASTSDPTPTQGPTPTSGPTPTPTVTPLPTNTPTPTPIPSPNAPHLDATVECTTQPDTFKSAGPTVTLKWNTIPPVQGIVGLQKASYVLHRTPGLTHGSPFWTDTASFIDNPSVTGSVAPVNGFYTIYDGSYVGVQAGQHYEYWVTAVDPMTSQPVGESNHISIDTPANCTVPASSPRNFHGVGSCPGGKPVVELYWNRMPYFEDRISIEQTPPVKYNSIDVGSGYSNPRPARLSGDNAFPTPSSYTYTLPDGSTTTVPWPCGGATEPHLLEKFVPKAHAQTAAYATDHSWIGYFPTTTTTYTKTGDSWKYLANCSQTAPVADTVPPVNGSCDFNIAPAGSYKMVIFADDSTTNKLLESSTFTVFAPGLTFHTRSVLNGVGTVIVPKHPDRPLFITILDAQNHLVDTRSGKITVADTAFVGTIDMHAPCEPDFTKNGSPFVACSIDGQVNLTSGNYLLKVYSPGFLQQQLPGFYQLTNTADITLLPQTLINGDITMDNVIDTSDYNVLLTCYGDKMKSDACKATPSFADGTPLADLNDDGIVDGVDYNIFIRSLAFFQGD